MPAQKVRLGFIGAGWWATANHIPILAQRDDVELTAVCRLGKDELRKVKERFGFPFATEDAAELVRQPLDAVVVTPGEAAMRSVLLLDVEYRSAARRRFSMLQQ